MTNGEQDENSYRQAIHSAKFLSEKIERLAKEEEWSEIETLIAERNQALEVAFVPALPEVLHDEARRVLARAKQQDKDLMKEAKQRQQSAGVELKKLNHNKKSIQSYLGGN